MGKKINLDIFSSLIHQHESICLSKFDEQFVLELKDTYYYRGTSIFYGKTLEECIIKYQKTKELQKELRLKIEKVKQDRKVIEEFKDEALKKSQEEEDQLKAQIETAYKKF